MNRRLLAVTSVAIVLVLAACGGDDGTGDVTPSSAPAPTIESPARASTPTIDGPGDVTTANTAPTTGSAPTTGPASSVNVQHDCPTSDADPAPAQPVSFPLGVDSSGQLLVDAERRPVLIQGDSPWSLIADLSLDDAELYLETRAAQGFNAILVNLIEHKFAHDAPANAAGDQPFLGPGDFSRPNDAYFDHAEAVLQRAEDLGFIVFLVPAYIGYEGTDHGWYAEMEASGPEALAEYGRYVGTRFAHHRNIVWTNGGDANPPRKELVSSIAEALREVDPDALHTAHAAPETAAAEFWGDASWLDLNNVYSYEDVYAAAAEQYASGHRPFFLLESTYENEFGATTSLLREQAYDALLTGATGQFFGNNPVWHFDGPGLHSSDEPWQEALESPGAASMTHAGELFEALPWWTLVPDLDGAFLVSGVGPDHDGAAAAVSCTGDLAVAYLPATDDVTIDTSQIAGTVAELQWYDPTTGEAGPQTTVQLPAGEVRVDSPGQNRDGDEDWLLVVHAS